MRRTVVLAVTIALLGGWQSAARAACSTQSTPGLTHVTVGGRSYELIVPSGLAPGVNVPLLVSFHGFGSDGPQHATQTGWPSFATSRGFIAAFPNGNFRSWNFSQNSPDVAFARQVVDHVAATYCVDASRVFASGHSNGAYFAQRLACDAEDRFAAVTEYAGGDPSNVFNPCSLSRGIAVGLFHGTADTVVPVQAGRASRDAWVAREHCPTPPSTETLADGVQEHYRPCDGGVEVTWRSYTGQGHLWPTGARRDDILSRMWTFLSAYPKP